MFNRYGKYMVLTGILLMMSQHVHAGDPTRPGRSYKGQSSAVKTQTGYQVTAIFNHGMRPQAIINGKLVAEGYQFSDATVKTILKDKVIISQQRDGRWQPVTLSVNPASSDKFSIRTADSY